MPVIANSAISAATQPGAEFAPSGTFVVRTLSGSVNLQCKLPGTSDWLYVAEVQGWLVGLVIHQSGTACPVTPDIPGTTYRLVPVSGPATADAWGA